MVWEIFIRSNHITGKKTVRQTTCFNDYWKFINSKESGVNSVFKGFFKRNIDLFATRKPKKKCKVYYFPFSKPISFQIIYIIGWVADAYTVMTKDVILCIPTSIFFKRQNGLFEITIIMFKFVQSTMISHYHMMYICEDDINLILLHFLQKLRRLRNRRLYSLQVSKPKETI